MVESIENSRTTNVEKVRDTIRKLDRDVFTNYDIVKITGLNYEQVKRILTGLQEIDEVKYMESNKMYIRVI